MDPVRVGDRLPAEEVATGLSSGADGASSSGPLVWSEAENGGGGTKDGSAADISVVFTASGEDEAADPKLKLRPRPVPKDNFFRVPKGDLRVALLLLLAPLGGLLELSIFLSYVRSTCTGDNGGGESMLTGNDPARPLLEVALPLFALSA